MAQMPAAVVGDRSSISGCCTWCTVTAFARVFLTNETKSSAPAMTVPPAADMSATKSSVNTLRNAAQSLRSSVRQYRAFNCSSALKSSHVALIRVMLRERSCSAGCPHSEDLVTDIANRAVDVGDPLADLVLYCGSRPPLQH